MNSRKEGSQEAILKAVYHILPYTGYLDISETGSFQQGQDRVRGDPFFFVDASSHWWDNVKWYRKK